MYVRHISIHVPLAGNVEVTCPYGTQEMAFLSTFPLRGTSHGKGAGAAGQAPYFYPRSPCGERLEAEAPSREAKIKFLSTFPLRGTSTGALQMGGNRITFLSTFPLRGTSLPYALDYAAAHIFLSTFPLRGTSTPAARRCRVDGYFYPRSPCGERHHSDMGHCAPVRISIHVPLAGNVHYTFYALNVISRHFYPRSPCGERRCAELRRSAATTHFYPRSPCGERREPVWYCLTGQEFLSTFPLRGTSLLIRPTALFMRISIHVPLAGNVTISAGRRNGCAKISIHVPLAGNVRCPRAVLHARVSISIHVPLAGNVQISSRATSAAAHFYPRSPCGERPAERGDHPGRCSISIHVPLAGNVALAGSTLLTLLVKFLSTFPLRGTSPNFCILALDQRYFYPRSPCGERLEGGQ